MAKKKKKKDTALDLVDQLISNEKKDKPKRKPGRPKGSKNKTKVPAKKNAATTAAKKTAGAQPTISSLEFVTPEAFEELGRPRWGYTTARIKQWKNKTTGYFEVKLEYQRAAIVWSRLSATMNWYGSTDEKHLALCRKEISAFKETYNLTEHDFFEVIEIAHAHGHKRKALLKSLKDTAKVVLENRRNAVETQKEKDAILFREVIKIPPNIKPILKFIKPSLSSIEDDIKGAVADLVGNTDGDAVISEHACPDHINYRGLRKPRNYCPTCLYFYKWNKKQGVKETRSR
jgi:hypothetical protein